MLDRSLGSDFLVSGGPTKSWIVGISLVTITTSGKLSGDSDKVCKRCALNDYPIPNSAGLGLRPGGPGGPDITPRGSTCWHNGWAEIKIRRPSGNSGWMMNLQNRPHPLSLTHPSSLGIRESELGLLATSLAPTEEGEIVRGAKGEDDEFFYSKELGSFTDISFASQFPDAALGTHEEDYGSGQLRIEAEQLEVSEVAYETGGSGQREGPNDGNDGGVSNILEEDKLQAQGGNFVFEEDGDTNGITSKVTITSCQDKGREDRGREDRGREDRGRRNENRGNEDREREDRGREDKEGEDINLYSQLGSGVDNDSATPGLLSIGEAASIVDSSLPEREEEEEEEEEREDEGEREGEDTELVDNLNKSINLASSAPNEYESAATASDSETRAPQGKRSASSQSWSEDGVTCPVPIMPRPTSHSLSMENLPPLLSYDGGEEFSHSPLLIEGGTVMSEEEQVYLCY